MLATQDLRSHACRGGYRAGSGRKRQYPADSKRMQVVIAPEVLRAMNRQRGEVSLRAYASALLSAAVVRSE